ncbi:MAG: NAD-dependent epimerase/dehydratase family protein [Elusimicrobiota bacterium]
MKKPGISHSGFYKDLPVLITGGLGFIGSNLAIELVRLGAKVTIIDSLIPQYGGNLFNIQPVKNAVKINIADVRDEFSMRYLVRGYKLMFNLAGQVSHIDSMEDPFTDLDINTKSQLSILEACRKNNPEMKIVFASTRQIYGKPLYLPVDEKHPLNPTDINGINKIAGEQYHLLYNSIYGIKTVVLRLTNTYGPRLLVKHNRQGFLGWFINLLLNNKEITIFGDGRQLRDLNYIDDVVDALLASGIEEKAVGRAMNLGDHVHVSLADIVKTMIKINGGGKFKLLPFPSNLKKIDIGDYYSDYDLANEILGWEPKTDLETGMKKTIGYYKKYGKQHYWR